MIFMIKEREIKKIKINKWLFVLTVILVCSILILNFVSFLF